MTNSAILRTAYALSLAGVPVVYVARPDDPTIKRWENPRVSKRTVTDVLNRQCKRERPSASSHARTLTGNGRPMRSLRITYSTAYGIKGFTVPVSIEETLKVAEDYALFGFEVHIL